MNYLRRCLNLAPPPIHSLTSSSPSIAYGTLSLQPQIFLSFQAPVPLQSLEISNQISHKQFLTLKLPSTRLAHNKKKTRECRCGAYRLVFCFGKKQTFLKKNIYIFRFSNTLRSTTTK